MNSSGLTNFLQKTITPIANKLERQKHLQAIKEGMMAIIPIIIIGSFALLPIAIKNLLGEGAVANWIGDNLNLLTYCNQFTTGLISVYAVYFIAKSLAQKYKLDVSHLPMVAVIGQFILCALPIEGGISVGYLGSEGLFTAIITAIATVEISKIFIQKNIVIKLPDDVPPMVSKSFSSLIPMFAVTALFSIISVLVQNATGEVFPAFIMKILAPALTSMDTLPAMLIVILITQLLWFFGLHGAAVTSAVWVPFAINYGAANISAYANGEKVVHFFTFGFYYSMLQATGSGLTLGLVILMIFSKVKSYKSIGKAALIPSLFGINEPLIFGLPMLLNPFMFIPFVFGPLLVTVITYFAMSSGLVGMPIAEPPGFLPPGVGAFLMTLDFKAVILVFFNLILMTAIYFPFFKSLEAEELKKESLSE